MTSSQLKFKHAPQHFQRQQTKFAQQTLQDLRSRHDLAQGMG